MPLIQIRRNLAKVTNERLVGFIEHLPKVAALALSSPEGGKLDAKSIMIEVDDIGPLDANLKDLNVRVYAQDYPTRSDGIDSIRNAISNHVRNSFPGNWSLVSWYVWVFLAKTSYESDTDTG